MNALELIRESASSFSSASWLQARDYADAVGRPPQSVESLIRRLLADAAVDSGTLSRGGAYMLRRLLRSRSFQAPYFGAISMFKKERLQPEDEPFTVREFVEAFSVSEHAFLTGIIFLHRMARRRSDAQLFAAINTGLQRGINLGWFIGKNLVPVGCEAGMMAGALPWVGLLPFPKADPYGLREYLRHLRENKRMSTDPQFEFKQWGCTSLQVGLLLLQKMGFGMNKVVPLMRAVTTKSPRPQGNHQEWVFRVADVWTRHVLNVEQRPSIPLQPSYYLSEELVTELSMFLFDDELPADSEWLSARRSDLTPEKAPQLFCGLSADQIVAIQQPSPPAKPSLRCKGVALVDSTQAFTGTLLDGEKPQTTILQFDEVDREQNAKLTPEEVALLDESEEPEANKTNSSIKPAQ